MIRLALIVTCLAISVMSIGCSAPIGCNRCDGYGCGGRVGGPLDGLRQMKRNLVCGGGCGEVYVGEWKSTPPDCQDPCCGDQWVGGATPCRPGCFQPGMLLRNLYGSRFCSGAESSVPCGCGSGQCDGGCGYVEGEVINGGSVTNSDCGCASCDARGAFGSRVRIAGGVPASDHMTRSASTRNFDAQVDRIRR
jgi:hypothetical protein